MSSLWLAPLAAGMVGAAALAVSARWLRREVASLQAMMRPLRTRHNDWSDRPQRAR